MAIDSTLLNKIKTNLRISHSALDEDLTDTIEAGLTDLAVCGVQAPTPDDPKETDPLILNALKLYCRKEYTDDPEKSAKYQERYDKLKACLMMAEGYRKVETDE